jgi:hypothetical protein
LLLAASSTAVALVAAPSDAAAFRFEPASELDVALAGVAPAPEPAAAPAKAWGDAGCLAVQVFGGYANDFDDTGIVPVSLGISWFPIRGLSLDLDAEGAYVSQPGDNAAGGGLALTIRWHFLDFETWSLYADAGVGFLVLSDPVPEDAASFVFTPRAGVGASFALNERTRVLTGVRWYHISNAQTASSNPAINALEVYAGLSFAF